MIKVGIVGATGYAGGELVRLILMHPEAEISWLASKSYAGESYASIYENMFQLVDLDCIADDLPGLAKETDVIFTATPQGYLAGILTEDILKETKVIDLSADYRISDVAVYEKWYGIEHKSPQLIPQGVYGLPETHRNEIKGKRLVANPGCYPTCSILTVSPLLAAGIIDKDTVIIDAKSGTSGAGRGAKTANLFCEVNENMKAYGVASHRHTPEIEEQLSLFANGPVVLSFTPHLVPMNRGILVTAYASVKKDLTGILTEEKIREVYETVYANEPFVRFLPVGKVPQTRFVEGSNFVDVNVVYDARTGRVVMMGAMDNLVKGAAGQAVQNMNILFDLPETTGLMMPPVFP